jgi:hypothetical protein
MDSRRNNITLIYILTKSGRLSSKSNYFKQKVKGVIRQSAISAKSWMISNGFSLQIIVNPAHMHTQL